MPVEWVAYGHGRRNGGDGLGPWDWGSSGSIR